MIIIATFLLISILIVGAPSQIKAYPFGDNSKLSIDTINQLLDLQVDSDKGDSSSDKGDSSSDKGDSSSDKGDSSSDKGDSSSDKGDSSSDKGDSSSDKGDSSSDKGDSSSDKGDSSSDKGSVDSNEGSKNDIENSTPDFFGNPSLEEDNGNKNDENKENSNANSPDFVSERENTNDKTPNFLKEPSGASDILDTDPTGEDNPPQTGEDNPPQTGEDNPPQTGEDNPPQTGEDNPPQTGEDNPPQTGEDNPPQTGEDNPPQTGEETPDQSKDKNDIKKKINGEFEKITEIISKTKTKVIVKDDDDNEKEIIIVGDPSCPTQSENVALNGIINPQGIRLLANFYPCTVENGGITMNIPDSPNLKLALIYIDNNSDNHAGTLITPNKIQSIENNQGLFSIELDKKMKGNDPITGEITTLDKINGLALYNNGNEPLEFKVGSSAALTTTFSK